MPDYTITISKTAQRQLDSLPDNTAEKLIAVIQRLAQNPRPVGYKKLRGRDGYRIKRGNYRILYEIIDQNLIIDIIAIGHRSIIYRQRK